MLVVVSPAKKLDFESENLKSDWSEPDYLDHSEKLIDAARKLTRSKLAKIMNISDAIADLNYERYRDFSLPFTLANARQAVFAFKGDTYVGLDAETLSEDDLAYAQDHFRILSGLYGILRPLDLIQPYRLEMGCSIKVPYRKNLYDFWNGTLTKGLNDLLKEQGSNVVVNCASNEYFKSIKEKDLNARVITPVFKVVKDGMAKSPGMMTKKARGQMARFIIQNRIKDPEGLKKFNADGYKFMPTLSDEHKFEFHRIA
jgi:cytoplasmic iron level regulating protein YaaA (DUF328/UPF0246 family)